MEMVLRQRDFSSMRRSVAGILVILAFLLSYAGLLGYNQNTDYQQTVIHQSITETSGVITGSTASLYAGNAIDDILDQPRYEGFMESIKGVTQFTDNIMISIITFVSFFIISMAILKNVIAAAYYAFPTFFDRVDEAKAMLQGSLNGLGGAGSVGSRLLALFPNFKDLVDFTEGERPSAKDWFMVNIPLMFLNVFIGVAIYNSYQVKAVKMVSNFASVMIERFFVSTDPVAAFDSIMGTAGDPIFATADDPTSNGKRSTDVKKAVLGAVLSTAKDLEKADAKAAVGTLIENKVNNWIPVNSVYFNDKRYGMRVQTNVVVGDPTTALNSIITPSTKEGTSEVVTKAFSVAMSELANDSKYVKDRNLYVRVVLNFTRVRAGSAADLNTNMTLVLPYAKSANYRVGNALKLPSSTFINVNNSWNSDGQAIGNNSLAKGFNPSVGTEYHPEGLTYSGGANPMNTITTIIFSNSATEPFILNDSKDRAIKWGDTITVDTTTNLWGKYNVKGSGSTYALDDGGGSTNTSTPTGGTNNPLDKK